MFGRSNNRNNPNNRLRINSSFKFNKDLDVPISFNHSNKEYIEIKKKEKEKRILERKKSEKLNIIKHYVKFYIEYRNCKKNFLKNLQESFLCDDSYVIKEINYIIRLYRFTANIDSIDNNIKKFMKITKFIYNNFEKFKYKISMSNLIFLLRNSLLLIFIEKNEDIDQHSYILNKLIIDIIKYIFLTANKGKELIKMILNCSMIDLLFIKFLESFSDFNDFDLFKKIINGMVEISISSFADDYNLKFLGNDILNFIKTKYYLKKCIKKNRNIQIENFLNNRIYWLQLNTLLLILKSRNRFGTDKCTDLFKENLDRIEIRTLGKFIMNENIDSIRLIKSPIHKFFPKSIFSYILLNYMMIEYIELNFNSIIIQDLLYKNIESDRKKNTYRLYEKEFQEILNLVGIWNFNLHSVSRNKFEYDLNYNYDDTNLTFMKLLIEIILKNCSKYNIGKENSILIENMKMLLIIRINILFCDLLEKINIFGSFLGIDKFKNCEIMRILKVEEFKDYEIISRMFSDKKVLNNLLNPIMNYSIKLLNKKETIEESINIINLILDIYFPLNQLSRTNIYDYNALNDLHSKKENYLHNAMDLCFNDNFQEIENDILSYKKDEKGFLKDIKFSFRFNKFKNSIKSDFDIFKMENCKKRIDYLFYINELNNETKSYKKDQDYLLFERIYNNLYLSDYENINSFLEQFIKGKVKFQVEISNFILNSLVYDTSWVLLLFLCTHNTIILNYDGNINRFIMGLFENDKCNVGNILKYFGLSLYHQIQFTDEDEIRRSVSLILNQKQNGNLQDVINFGDDNPINIPSLDLNIVEFELKQILNNDLKTQQYGSVILNKILERIKNKDLNFLINYGNFKTMTSPFLLINNKDLNYMSLFINNLTFLMLNYSLEIKGKNLLISIFGELTRKIYQIYLKLNYDSIKLDENYIKLPWTILEASNLLKPKDILLKQAIHIESLGTLPTNNITEEDVNMNLITSSSSSDQLNNSSLNNIIEMDQYDQDDNKSDLINIFDSTLRYVSNKSKFGLLQQILRELPHLIGFEDRLYFYYHYIAELRYNYIQPENFSIVPKFEIRRTHLIEDGINNIANLDPNRLRNIFRIIFLDEQGEVEPGIDGGGLLKDFITCISKEMCSPKFGLFIYCKDNSIVPRDYDSLMEISNNANIYGNIFDYTKLLSVCDNLSRNSSNKNNVLSLFEFLGKIVGKAIYEKILLEIEFNPVFLNSVFGQYNDFNDLSNFDEELHKNLKFIKNYNKDIKNLSLTFSISTNLSLESNLNKNKNSNYIEVDLVPNGRNIIVNNENKFVYIKLLTRYKLITSIKLQAEAFLKGLSTVIPYESLRLFSPYEIQSLISGVYQKLDVENLRENTCYTGYLESSKQIIWLWNILENEFNVEEQSEFLLFVTSSRKAPLLGFQHLNPKFGIQIVPDDTRLPSASTCFNLLKLPTYKSKEILKNKLKQAIFGSKGFDLS